MSYRPTISIYIDGHIADIGYYRNWSDENLFFEALALAALFSECKSVREYTFKKYGKEKVYISLDPVLFENTEKNMKFLESCSECPILIDLTAKCIYRSVGVKTGKRLRRIPSVKIYL